MPKASVIIVTWNSRDYIGPCLDSVLSQSVDSEVIVVDNASGDGTVDVLESYGDRVRLVKNPANQGFAKASNQGIDLATGELLLLLNPDTVMQPHCLAAMIACMDVHPACGVLGPQLLNKDGSIQPSCREFPRAAHVFYEFTGLAALFPRHPFFGSWRMGYFDHTTERAVDQPMGACLLVRRRTIFEVGLLDHDNYPMFFNEVDWCRRIKQAGWDIVFFPDARVMHHQGVSIRRARLAMTVTSHRSLSRFLGKHYPGRASTVLAQCLLYLALPFRLLFQSVMIPAGRVFRISSGPN